MKRGYLFALAALSLLTMISLVLNGMMILALVELRQTARRVVADTRELVTRFADDTLSYTVEVDQDVPAATEIPLNESVVYSCLDIWQKIREHRLPPSLNKEVTYAQDGSPPRIQYTIQRARSQPSDCARVR